MEQIELRANTREILGKKVRFLRRQGLVPTHLFGYGIESMALQCDTAQLKQVLAQAGTTRLISLKLDKARKSRRVVAREIQRESISGELLHVDFYQVRMTEKMKVEVPLVLIGEAPALKSKENMLAQDLHSLTIECLPDQMPANITVDISSLTEAEQGIYVKDITLDEEVTVINDPEHLVVKINVRRIEKLAGEEGVVAEEEAESLEEAETKEE